MHDLQTLGPLETPANVAGALRTLVVTGALSLPLPGAGHTAARFAALAEIAAHDLSLGRLAEGHTDAIAILAEAGVGPHTEARYGVWAAEPPSARVRAERTPDGWILHGCKRYCSGAHGLERVLLTAEASDGGRLFDVALTETRVHEHTWAAIGMANSESLEVDFEGVTIPETAAVGRPGFYLERAGFWHGAVGVAACWFGGALGAYRMLRGHLGRGTPNEHQLAHLGAVAAACNAMQAVLEEAARAIDAGQGHEQVALGARHVVEQSCQEVLQRVGRASGTTPLVFDRAHARRAADLVVYLRQHHAERDLAALGRLALEDTRCSS